MQSSPKRASAARRPWNALAPTGDFAALVARVVAIIEDARSRVVRTVNSEMVLSDWHIGREIVEYVQRGESRAEYGEQVIEDLSAQLLARIGHGYSTRNLWYFRDFYLTYRERAPSMRAEVFRTSLVQIRSRSMQPGFCTRLVQNSPRGSPHPQLAGWARSEPATPCEQVPRRSGGLVERLSVAGPAERLEPLEQLDVPNSARVQRRQQLARR